MLVVRYLPGAKAFLRTTSAGDAWGGTGARTLSPLLAPNRSPSRNPEAATVPVKWPGTLDPPILAKGRRSKNSSGVPVGMRDASLMGGHGHCPPSEAAHTSASTCPKCKSCACFAIPLRSKLTTRHLSLAGQYSRFSTGGGVATSKSWPGSYVMASLKVKWKVPCLAGKPAFRSPTALCGSWVGSWYRRRLGIGRQPSTGASAWYQDDRFSLHRETHLSLVTRNLPVSSSSYSATTMRSFCARNSQMAVA